MVAKGKRAEAKAAGLAYYFTGEPCIRGHITKRIVANGECHQCFLENKETKRRKEGRRLRSEITAETHASARVCSKCKLAFPNTDEFFVQLRKIQPSGTVSTGLSRECRTCLNKRFPVYYEQHRGKLIARATVSTRQRRLRPEVQEQERISSRKRKRVKLADPVERKIHNKRGRDWRKNNPEKAKQFKHEQPPMKAFRAMMRLKRVCQATPAWTNLDLIKALYEIAYEIMRRSGVPQDVDHIHPIQHKRLCGLNVPWNLRISPAMLNRVKGNRLPFDTGVMRDCTALL